MGENRGGRSWKNFIRNSFAKASSDVILMALPFENYQKIQSNIKEIEQEELLQILKGAKVFGQLGDTMILSLISYLEPKVFRMGEYVKKKNEAL